MTKRLVEIDDELLDRARSALGVGTIKATVNEALREAVAAQARRRQIQRLASGSLSALSDKAERQKLWR